MSLTAVKRCLNDYHIILKESSRNGLPEALLKGIKPIPLWLPLNRKMVDGIISPKSNCCDTVRKGGIRMRAKLTLDSPEQK